MEHHYWFVPDTRRSIHELDSLHLQITGRILKRPQQGATHSPTLPVQMLGHIHSNVTDKDSAVISSRLAPTLFLIFSLIAIACSNETPSMEVVIVDDIPLILNYSPLLGTVAGEIVEAEDVLLIDGEFPNGPPEAILGAPQEIAIGPDGRIYVLDTQDQRIKIFDRDGGFLKAFGGRGGGPGELTFGWRLGIWDGTLGVAEGQMAQLHLFDLEGRFLDRLNLPTRGINGIAPFAEDTYLLNHSYRDGNAREIHDYVVWMERVDLEGNLVPFDTKSGMPDPGRSRTDSRTVHLRFTQVMVVCYSSTSQSPYIRNMTPLEKNSGVLSRICLSCRPFGMMSLTVCFRRIPVAVSTTGGVV